MGCSASTPNCALNSSLISNAVYQVRVKSTTEATPLEIAPKLVMKEGSVNPFAFATIIFGL